MKAKRQKRIKYNNHQKSVVVRLLAEQHVMKK